MSQKYEVPTNARPVIKEMMRVEKEIEIHLKCASSRLARALNDGDDDAAIQAFEDGEMWSEKHTAHHTMMWNRIYALMPSITKGDDKTWTLDPEKMTVSLKGSKGKGGPPADLMEAIGRAIGGG